MCVVTIAEEGTEPSVILTDDIPPAELMVRIACE
jgi:hypothetical protein